MQGAQTPDQAGAPPSTVDYANVGAQDPEDLEEGGNPYAGLTDAQLQEQFERDQARFKVGNPLTTQRHISTLNNRLNGYHEVASSLNRNDILKKIDTAKENLGHLKKQLKARADNGVLQNLLDQSLQESNAIKISLAQAQ